MPDKRTAPARSKWSRESGLGRRLATDWFFQGSWIVVIAALISQAAIMLLLSL